MQFTGEDGEVVQGLSGMHPTNVGAIQVNCYASADTFEQYASLFSQVITSVQVDDEWKYRERNALQRAIGSWNDLASSAGTGAVGGLVAVAIVRALKKRKQAPPNAVAPGA